MRASEMVVKPHPERPGSSKGNFGEILPTNLGFLFGHFTLADAFYAPMVTRFATYGVALPAPAAAYCERIRALPAMQEWIAAAKVEATAAPA